MQDLNTFVYMLFSKATYITFNQGHHALIIFEGAQVGGGMWVDTAVGLCFT